MWHHPYMAPGTWRSGVSRGHREGIKPLPSMPSRERPSAQGMYVAGSHSQSLDIVLVHIKQKQNMPRHIRISTLLRCCYSIFQNPAYLAPIARTRLGCTLYIKFSLYTRITQKGTLINENTLLRCVGCCRMRCCRWSRPPHHHVLG